MRTALQLCCPTQLRHALRKAHHGLILASSKSCLLSCPQLATWALRRAKAAAARAQSNQTLEHPLQWLVGHPEHDAIYVDDPACRSFGREALRGLCNLMLENLPTGARHPVWCPVTCKDFRFRVWMACAT